MRLGGVWLVAVLVVLGASACSTGARHSAVTTTTSPDLSRLRSVVEQAMAQADKASGRRDMRVPRGDPAVLDDTALNVFGAMRQLRRAQIGCPDYCGDDRLAGLESRWRDGQVRAALLRYVRRHPREFYATR